MLIFKEKHALLSEFTEWYKTNAYDTEKALYLVDNMLMQAYYLGLMSTSEIDFSDIQKKNRELTEKINQTEKQMNMLKTKVKKQIKNFKI
jgi:hypothetical protein